MRDFFKMHKIDTFTVNDNGVIADFTNQVLPTFYAGTRLDDACLEKIALQISEKIKKQIDEKKIPENTAIFFKLEITPERAIIALDNKKFQNSFQTVSTTWVSYEFATTKVTWQDQGTNYSGEFSTEDLAPHLDQIKQTLCDKISNHLPKYKLLIIDRDHSIVAHSLANNLFLKTPLTNETDEKYLQAIERLVNMPVKSPFLFYDILYSSQKTNCTYFILISDKINVIDLKSLAEQKLVSAKKALSIVRDCMQGAIHLLNNQLVLTDLSLENLFLNRESDRGLLLDYDGLRITGTQGQYLAHEGYHPPEFGETFKDCKVEAPQMIFEFGVSITSLLKNYDLDNNSSACVIKLKELANKMTSSDPKARPDFNTAIAQLATIIDQDEFPSVAINAD